jgi:competence CoiA-like predicted nuclease
MSFTETESYKHKAAKEVLRNWLNDKKRKNGQGMVCI